jgi:hypothetical protein
LLQQLLSILLETEMKRHFLIISCVLFAFTLTYSLLFADDDNFDVPMKTIILKAPADAKVKKTPVLFDHTSHSRFACLACHHEWDLVSDIQGCSASGCHEKLMPSPPSGMPSQGGSAISITGAFHRACRQCHRDYQKEIGARPGDEEVAPVACDGCHPKTFAAEESDDGSFPLPTGTITLSAPEDAYAKRPSVEFPHGLHFQQNCEVCHHEWDGGDMVTGCSTEGCHDQAEPDESTRNINDPANVLYYLTAYHKVCYSCHMDLKKQAQMTASAESSAPTLCAGCHNAE